MSPSFFFYDLETSGISPRSARIMQFAGQRTDEDLNPIGEPFNILVKLAEDTLPEPDAILITGITPQKTIAEGIPEAEFFNIFCKEIALPGTVFVGFNNIRFDDEFMRYGLYRNFFDPYDWQWRDAKSKWDILDLVRLTRALRPEGIKWPFASDGKPSNRLELLTSLNGLEHKDAHDALSDVKATIDVARMIKQYQPKLFDFYLSLNQKSKVREIAESSREFVYVSGAYPSEYEKLTVVHNLGKHPKKDACLVFDLRINPEPFIKMNVGELIDSWQYSEDPDKVRLPVKTLQYNRCPAVAPTSTLAGQEERLQLDSQAISANLELLKNNPDFYDRVKEACSQIENTRLQTVLLEDQNGVDGALYNDFVPDGDKKLFVRLHETPPENLSQFVDKFHDKRLKSLLPLYKARNFPKSLTDEERQEWENFRKTKLQKTLPKFFERLQQKSQEPGLTANQTYLLEELQLYAESIMPVDL